MFWKQKPYTHEMFTKHCKETFNKVPRFGYLEATLGPKLLNFTSNIVFANGLLDPWSAGGIRSNISASLVAVDIAEGAHHLDFFFSTEQDPVSVVKARQTEVYFMRKWAQEGTRRYEGVQDALKKKKKPMP